VSAPRWEFSLAGIRNSAILSLVGERFCGCLNYIRWIFWARPVRTGHGWAGGYGHLEGGEALQLSRAHEADGLA
jgi:hypothetical protein